MSVLGVGIDIVFLESFRKAMEQGGFIKRVFTEKEIRYCESTSAPLEHFAGRFAAKEAVIKALGKNIPLSAIEIERSPSGQPYLLLLDKVAKKVQCSLSIAHAKDYAVASVICQEKE